MRQLTKRRGERGEGGLRLILTIAGLAALVMALWKIVPLHISGNEVKDAMDEASNFGNMKPNDKLVYEIVRRAQNAHTPLRYEDVKIERRAGYITISAKYTQTADVFGYKYTYVFDHTVEKQTF